jgi:hypothetical protein
LVIKPSGKPGRFLGYLGDELIITSRQPFLDGARALLARGYAPATPHNMRHANSGVLSFVTTNDRTCRGIEREQAPRPVTNSGQSNYMPDKFVAGDEQHCPSGYAWDLQNQFLILRNRYHVCLYLRM